jgi:5-methylcytosine-specific restriction protein B
MTDVDKVGLPGYELDATDMGYQEATGADLDIGQIDVDGLSDSTSFNESDIEEWLTGLKRKKQAIFYGPPGTGKTFTAKKIADELVSDTDGFRDIVQFHQNYEYEDFIQGIRPSTGSGYPSYNLESGTFLDFCEEAAERNSPCVLIIDEINRADLSAVFGELMYLLEYREDSVQLSQSQIDEDDSYTDADGFEIPDNVYIMGTMNTADRSIALVDFALRRRFAFLELRPNWDVLREKFSASGVDVDDLVNVMESVNDDIGDRNYELGHTYFLQAPTRDVVRNIWNLEIVPYLEEFFIDQPDKVDNYRWEEITSSSSFDL